MEIIQFLIHLIKFFCKQNIKDFVFCLGYKSNSVINYFIKENKKKIVITSRSKNLIQFKYKSRNLKFNAALVFTGIKSGTGGRIAIAYKKLKLDEDFLMTYGDGLSNVSIKKLIRFHYKNKSDVTLTAVRPKQRYGILGYQ